MIPNFGDILTKNLSGANTPELARIGIAQSLSEFWSVLIANNSIGNFMFKGTAIEGPTTVPVVGTIGSFSTGNILYIPSDLEIKNALETTPNVWQGFFKLFATTIKLSTWFVDCKAASFSTPYLTKLNCMTDVAYSAIFKLKMESEKPNTQFAAMNIVSQGVKEFLQTVVNEVPYIGTGAGQLSGTMTIAFNSHI